MRPIVPLHRRYQRTCRECGYQWEVTPAVASSGSVLSAAMGSTRAATRGRSGDRRGLNGAGVGVDRASAQRAQDAVHAFSICAQCGVSNFTQESIRRQR